MNTMLFLEHPCHFGLKRVMKSTIVSSSRPNSVALGDFNNDQQIDLVVANSGTNTIGVFLSQGDGMFSKEHTYFTDSESYPCSVTVSHLNNDDYVDIAVANYATNNIGIFLGHGDGTFTDQTQFSTGSSHPLFITTADVNNDNVTDLLVVNYGTNSVGIHLGYGNGSFHDQKNYFTEYDSLPHSLALGDFNNDNHLDIAVANYGTNNIGILLGYGNGTFGSQTIYTTLSNSHPSSLALGDFNHDDHLDIVVSNNGSGNVGIFLGHGDGSFEAQKIYPLDPHSHPEYITVGDLNEDNELDVIIVDSINDRVHILLVDGHGSFATTTTYDTISESSPKSVGVADFNNNNQSDIVVVNCGISNVLVLMDYSNKPSIRQTNYKLQEFDTMIVAVGDFNNDHIPDIVSNSGSYILILHGLADGSFDRRSISTIITSATIMQYICVEDVNNDSWMDIVTANYWDDNVGVLLGRGNGTFGAITTYSTGNDSHPAWVGLGDMNADGHLDIVCANKQSRGIDILFGNGDGTFATIMNCFTFPDFFPFSAALGDINNDHRLDVAAVGRDGYIYVLIRDSTGNCIPPVILRTNGTIYSIVLADFNSDKNLDIAFIDTQLHNVGVFLGYGDGTFTEQRIYQIDNQALVYNLIVADFNNDQMSDLATAVSNNGEVVIFYGHGDGSFTLARRYSTGFGSAPFDIAAAYFDYNQQVTIVVTLRTTGEIAVLTEYTAAEFVQQLVYSTGSTAQPFSVATGDFTHDNRSDIVIANSGTDDLTVLVGTGNGTFEREMVYGIGVNSHPQCVITCNIDQDQQLDIVSVNPKLDIITVIMGQSDGTFADQTVYSTGGGSHPSAVASGDLNSDGRLDLVIANEGTDNIGVLFGFDYATFQDPVIYSSNDTLQPIGIVVCDFNNDGFQDIATAFYLSHRINIYVGCGNGSFILAMTYSMADGAGPYAITAVDLNNDGQADIVVSDIRSDTIGILLGYGNGSFATVRMYSSGGSRPASVAVGDMNNDNRLDLVVANSQSGNVTVLYGYGDGTFSTAELYYTDQDFKPEYIILCDLNNDGRLDFVVVNTFFDTTDIFTRYGSGVAGDEVISSTIANPQPRQVIVTDFNNDSRLDYVVALFYDGSVVIKLNNGNGTFAPSVSYSVESTCLPTSLEVGDFNNDNILDIVIACSILTSRVVVLFGIGNGTFLLGRQYLTGIGADPFALAIGDFNNDTRLDIAVSNLYGNNMAILLGSGNELFGSIKTYGTGDGSRPYSVAVADVNNDHQMDIVVANYGTDNVGVLLGGSDREFTSVNTYSTGAGSRPYCVGIADFNNDNYFDIVVTTSETDSIVLLLGNNNGTFAINATYSTGYRSRPYTLVISDFNNDHIWDIALANSGTSNIFLIYGFGDGRFGNETFYSLGYGYHPYSIAVTDLNSDGWMDIVVACFDTDHIEVFIQMC